MYYNLGLALAGILAFICYVVVCVTLLPRVLDAAAIKINFFTTLLQGIGYLLLMGIANIFYSLGPLSERVFRPSDPERYRQISFRLGFCFSVLLPFVVPTLLAFLVIFFPGMWKGR